MPALAKVGMAPGNIDANSLQTGAADCEGTCSLLLFGDETKDPADKWNTSTADSNFKTAWSTSNDQWCADHGSPTNEATPAIAEPQPVVSGSPAPSIIQASVPYTPGSCPYPRYPNEDCATVKKKLLRCKLKNSQLESQCLAYYHAKDGLNWQWTLVVIDSAAAASCLGACYMGDQMNPALSKVCTATGVAAVGTEAFAILKMKNSTFMKVISGGAAAGGAAMLGQKAITAEESGKNAGSAVQTASTATDLLAKKQAEERQSACMAGYFFTALAGIRAYNIYDTNQTQENACKSIQDLASQSAAIGATGGFKAPDTTFANLAAATPGQGTGTAAVGTTANSTTAPSTTTTLNPTTAQLVGQAATADDGRLLNRGDLLKRALPKAQQINPNQMYSALMQDPGRTVAQSIAGMGGNMPTSVMQGIDGITRDISKNRKMYAKDVLGSDVGVYRSGGSGGGSGAHEKDSGGANEVAAAISGLFGAMQEGAPAGAKPPASTEFTYKGQDSGDIFHSQAVHTSIFDIVSSRIRKATHRTE